MNGRRSSIGFRMCRPVAIRMGCPASRAFQGQLCCTQSSPFSRLRPTMSMRSSDGCGRWAGAAMMRAICTALIRPRFARPPSPANGRRGAVGFEDALIQGMPPRIPEQQLIRARDMRRGQTLAEDMLWRGLRDRRLGAKFRRQVPIGAFIADFACVEAKLVIEVDGPSHETAQGRVLDNRRDRWLRENGWSVVRVPKRSGDRRRGSGAGCYPKGAAGVGLPFSRLREKVSMRSSDG